MIGEAMMVCLQLGAVSAKTGSFVSRRCRLFSVFSSAATRAWTLGITAISSRDTADRLDRTERWTLGVECRLLDVQLFTYDDLGEPLLTCEDLDLNGVIDLSGPDRVSGRSSRHVQISGDWWQESASWIYPGDGSSAPLTNAVVR